MRTASSTPLARRSAPERPTHATRGHGAGWCQAWMVRLVLLLAAFGATARGGEISKEYKIKAAFLYNFTKFVEWPPDRFPADTAPIVIGVLGKEPFGGELEQVVAGRKVNGRSITIVALRSIAEAGTVHVLFVTAGEEKRFGAMDPSKLAGVLTVGESDQFASLGGIMNFTTIEDKVRFEINADVADHVGIKISSQLQKLACLVRRKS